MACVPLPSRPQVPDIFPISVEPPDLGPIDVDLDVCCKLLDFTAAIPIPLPPIVLNPAVILTINQALKAAEAYLDALPLDCPLE